MEINLELLIDYSTTLGQKLTINVDIEDFENPILVFQKGKYRDNGNSRVLIEFRDLMDILSLNNIIGENGKIKQELSSTYEIPANERGPHIKKFEINTEKYIYETLSKYIIQMLNASIGKIYFPEITYLEKHNDYFKNN